MTAAPAEQAPTSGHRNEVYLVGELSSRPAERTLSDGRDAVTFRLDVRVDTDGGPARDSLDVTVTSARARKSALTWEIGDAIEVDGVVRRKFYKVGAASRPFTVIEAQRVKRLRR